MFAVIKTGGKQYKVAENDQIVVEKLDAEAGEQVKFDQVLLMGDDGSTTLGAPIVEGAAVFGQVEEQRKGDKVIIMKKRQRSTYRRKKGHRQLETVVTITSILADGSKAPKPKKKAAPKAKAEETKPVEAKEEAPKKEAAPKKTPAAKKEETPAAEEKKAAPKKAPAKKAAAPAAADDLTKLKGVGKVMAGKMNEAGITTFKQLAAVKGKKVAELEETLKATGKLEAWIAEAKELAG